MKVLNIAKILNIMNITEQIAEFLHQGKTVVIPGIGSFSSKQVDAHYDAATQTFYPTQQRIVFDRDYSGTNIMTQYIAEKECVSISTADQMWRNYVDALEQKLIKNGSHEFPGIGTLTKDASNYSFAAAEGTNSDNTLMHPIEGVVQYAPKAESRNPFAVFDTPFVSGNEPAPVAEMEPPEEAPVAEMEHAEPAKEEIEDVTQEPEQPVQEPIEEYHQEKVADFIKPAAPEPVETKEPEDVPETATAIAETPQQEPTQTIQEPTTTIDESATIAEPETSSTDATPLNDLKTLEKMQEEIIFTPDQSGKKKKRKIWPFILIIIILLLGGGAYCYFFQPDMVQSLLNRKSNPAPAATTTAPADIEQMVSDSVSTDSLNVDTLNVADETASEETTDAVETTDENTAANTTTTDESTPAQKSTAVASKNTPKCNAELDPLFSTANVFTFNTDLVTYQPEDIATYQGMVMTLMNGYLENYARSQHYSKAAEALKARANEYTGQRLNDLLTPATYSARRFLPYDDAITKYCHDALKMRKARQQKTVVQTELMDNAVLNRLLQEVVSANNITSDAVKAAPKANKPYRSTASYSTHSKRGYDVIAGFFVNKNYADRMASGLKQKGCDAYVIEIQQGYYVSMGSAESRTKAEAIYSHLKEWYRGDMSIKKF